MSHGLRITLSAPAAAGVDENTVDGASETGLPAIQLSGERAANGLAQLVLILIKLLHELLQRQALRRMEAGGLSEEEIERLGQTLMRQAAEIERLCELLDLRPEDLNLDLGPLGRLFD
ncbi:MAG TPA: gas vesicle protein K [Methylococcus sp.]|nr:gas vesicle protein K [Methylococcus sp.]